MTPVALLFSRYRPFRDEERVELPPLTLIIGRNGGGKSVLTRLPLIIAAGLNSRAEVPIDLSAGGIRHAARYEDLVYQRSAQPFMLGAEISDGHRFLKFKTTLRHVVENYELAYEKFELFENNCLKISLSIASPDEFGKAHSVFHVDQLGEAIISGAEVDFIGLFPRSISGSESASAILAAARDKFEAAFHAPAYLGPFRSEQVSTGRVPRQGIQTLGPRGDGALDLLGDDVLRGTGALMRSVEAWFEASMSGSRVHIEGGAGIPRLLVHDSARNLDVEIAETGAGFAQVVPIVAQVIGNDHGRLRNAIAIVEQPELHLHPGAHGSVADLFINSVESGNRCRYICETHSEQFVTRVRRRIAEAKISPESVQILSVGHQVERDGEFEILRRINVDQYGNVDAWPVGVFDEAFDDLVALREAAVRREAAEVGDVG